MGCLKVEYLSYIRKQIYGKEDHKEDHKKLNFDFFYTASDREDRSHRMGQDTPGLKEDNWIV